MFGLAPDSSVVALVIDDHQVAGDPDLVTVRVGIANCNRRNHAWLARVGDVEDRRAKPGCIRDVPDKAKVARDSHLPGAGQVEVAKKFDVFGKRYRVSQKLCPSHC